MPKRKGEKTSYEKLIGNGKDLIIGDDVDRASRPRDKVYSIALTDSGRGALEGIASTGIAELQRHQWELALMNSEDTDGNDFAADIDSREAYYEVLNLTELNINDVVGVIVFHVPLEPDAPPVCEVTGRMLVSDARGYYPECDIPSGWNADDYVLIVTEYYGNGLKGDKGDPGTNGTNGADGAQGQKGDKGDPGTCPECHDPGTITDPPPNPGHEPPDPPTDPPPPDSGGRVELECNTHQLHLSIGTNDSNGWGKLEVTGSTPLFGTAVLPVLLVNIASADAIDIYSAINSQIAASGLLPAGKKVSSVKLGYGFTYTSKIGMTGSILGVNGFDLVVVKSIQPNLVGKYKGNTSPKMYLPVKFRNNEADYKIALPNFFGATITWQVDETPFQTPFVIDDWANWSELKLWFHLMPALPNFPFWDEQPISPLFELCLLGFDYEDDACGDCLQSLPYNHTITYPESEPTCFGDAANLTYQGYDYFAHDGNGIFRGCLYSGSELTQVSVVSMDWSADREFDIIVSNQATGEIYGTHRGRTNGNDGGASPQPYSFTVTLDTPIPANTLFVVNWRGVTGQAVYLVSSVLIT